MNRIPAKCQKTVTFKYWQGIPFVEMELKERGGWSREFYKPQRIFLRISILLVIFALAFIFSPVSLKSPSGLITSEAVSAGGSTTWDVNAIVSDEWAYLLGFGIFLVMVMFIFIVVHYHRRKGKRKVEIPLVEDIPVAEQPPAEPRRKFSSLDDELNHVNAKLAGLNKNGMETKKATVITTLPCTKGHDVSVEELEAVKEKRRIQKILTKSDTQPARFLGFFRPRSKTEEEVRLEKEAEEEVRRIAQRIEGKNPAPKSELLRIEEEIAKLKEEYNFE